MTTDTRRIFVHPERAATPLLTPCLGAARIARADGAWVRDTGGHAVLVNVAPTPGNTSPQVATGLLLTVPEALVPALDLMWRGPAITLGTAWVTLSLRRDPVSAWVIQDLRHARMYAYRIPRGLAVV